MRAAILLTATMAIAQAVPPASADGCFLLSPAEIETATGMRVAPGVARIHTAALTSCTFVTERGGEIHILVRRAPTHHWISAQIARMERGAYQEVAGIGDRAFVYALGNTAVLCVFHGDAYVQISLSRMAGGRPALVPLARSLMRGSESSRPELTRARVGNSNQRP